MRGRHSSTCASGARAETRGQCDCGAGELPYRARTLKEVDETGRRKVEIQIDGPLTTGEATMLGLYLLELTKQEGQRWARGRR
jgi:hypothetical protein